jgi:hypothetical protein
VAINPSIASLTPAHLLKRDAFLKLFDAYVRSVKPRHTAQTLLPSGSRT